MRPRPRWRAPVSSTRSRRPSTASGFTAAPVVAKRGPARETVQVKAIRPERDGCEIRFPRVAGYRVAPPGERLAACFTEDSTLTLTPKLVGATVTRNEGIVGEGVDLTLEHLESCRHNTLAYHLAKRLLETSWREPGEAPKLHLFGQLKRIVQRWLKSHLRCEGETLPAMLLYAQLAELACQRITDAINRAAQQQAASNRQALPVTALLDPYNPSGSTATTTSKKLRWQTAANRCHVNLAVCDSDWEAECCRVLESHPRVRAYVKNQGLGFEVPYRLGAEARTYIPDFIALIDDGRGADDLLHLIVEVKGCRGEDANVKKETTETYWLPAVNRLGEYGRWAFVELKDVYAMRKDVDARLAEDLGKVIAPLVGGDGG